MPDTPIKLTLEADWGTSETKKGDKKLHGRIYRIKAGQYMFVSAAYDGSKIKFRAWPCTRAGKHEHNPMFVGTDMTIGVIIHTKICVVSHRWPAWVGGFPW